MKRHARTRPYGTSATPVVQTVIITYDECAELFLSSEEQHPFSPEKLLDLIERRAQERRVCHSSLGYLTIQVGAVCCHLSTTAVQTLSLLYQRSTAYQRTFPLCQPFLLPGNSCLA
jgi:hypothetical protein